LFKDGGRKYALPTVQAERCQLRDFALRSHDDLRPLRRKRATLQPVQHKKTSLHRGFSVKTFSNNYLATVVQGGYFIIIN